MKHRLQTFFEDSAVPGRCKTSLIAGISLLLAILNALMSVVLVALAVPGDGSPGLGFKIIATTFILGNLAGIALALFLAWRKNWLVQVLGLTTQLMTIPLCLGIAVLILAVLGIEDL